MDSTDDISKVNQAAQDVYTQIRAAGVIIIAAAGNDASSQLGYPASYEGVVSVSAAAHGSGGNPEDAILASYSTFGKHSVLEVIHSGKVGRSTDS